MRRENESRPAGNGTAIRNTGERSDSILPQVNLVTLTPRERDLFWSGYQSGYCQGHEAGVRFADDQAASLHREAVRVVHLMAGLPEVDREAAREAAARRERRWAS
ncbi:hypothetical protein [Phycicoccus avicenniae]|uniref:hypothetical protein n=1 Tax=Phycicoccus avicenniae TaxID=2828860 RepID=UPI003D29C1C9